MWKAEGVTAMTLFRHSCGIEVSIMASVSLFRDLHYWDYHSIVEIERVSVNSWFTWRDV